MIRASVIVPAHNAAATLGDTLEALARQEGAEPFEVIVVDDGSSDGTIAVAERAELPVTVLRRRGLGPGPARNEGVAVASGAAIAFTDADCAPTRGWLRAGLEALENADLVQGAVHAAPVERRLPFERTVWVTGEAGLYECASLFVRRELFERLGGFEDWLGARLGKQLAEDTWLGWRARRVGARTSFSEDALVHHAVFPRGLLRYVKERLRLVYFPAIAAKIPELRGSLLFARVFLTRRTAAFDLGVAGAALAVAAGSAMPLIGAGPWAWIVLSASVRWRRHAPRAFLGEALADAVGFAALLVGSLRWRTLVI